MKPSLLDDIRSAGYWRVNFRPLELSEPHPLRLEQCAELVRTNAVELRGWDYPHFPSRESAEDTGIDRLEYAIQGWVDWNSHRELWRMYSSTQFLHYRALHEDWTDLDRWGGRPANMPQGRTLGIITNLWLITEVFEFLARLMQRGEIYGSGAKVSLELRGSAGRMLWMDDSSRFPLMHDRSTQAPTITYTREVEPVAVLDVPALAVEASQFFYERFGFGPSADQLRSDVDRLYQQ